MVGLVVPSTSPYLLKSTGTASQSPFVIAARAAGIKVVPSIINAVILTSAWSSGNSSLLTGSRTIYGMAREKHAPKIFLRTNRFGIPYVAIALFGAFICLAYLSLSDGANVAFSWLQDLVSAAAVSLIITLYDMLDQRLIRIAVDQLALYLYSLLEGRGVRTCFIIDLC